MKDYQELQKELLREPKTWIITGVAGFIGSNIVRTLNEQGRNDIIVVDDLSDGTKFKNISENRDRQGIR